MPSASPTTSPKSPSFNGTNECECCPSLAPSADSAGSWEGASHIFDDYQYSRFSMTSNISMSSCFSFNAASRQYRNHDWVPIRVVADRGWIRRVREGGICSAQEQILPGRGSIRRTRYPRFSREMIQWRRISPREDLDVEEEMDDDGHQPLREIPKRSTMMTDRTRPAPLNITQQPSPLLHTSWGSSSGSSFVCCRKRVCIPCFVEIVIEGVHTRTLRRARRNHQYWECVACTSAKSDYLQFRECDADED